MASERETLSAAGKLSCFNGLRLDGSEPINYDTAAVHHGVLRLVLHIESFLANGVPDVSTTFRRKMCTTCPHCVSLIMLDLRASFHRLVPTCSTGLLGAISAASSQP